MYRFRLPSSNMSSNALLTPGVNYSSLSSHQQLASGDHRGLHVHQMLTSYVKMKLQTPHH